VLAGPGTGKTQVLAMRIANILRQTQMDPENILCLTFTGSATVANQGNFYYVDDAQLGYATSTDAVNWDRQTPDEPLPLSYVNPGYPRVYYVHDRLHIWFTDRWTTTLPDDSERDLAWLNYGIIDW